MEISERPQRSAARRKVLTAKRKRALVPLPPAEVPDPVDARLLAVFNNSLVFENIASYLSFGDMKAVSEVSRDFCGIIRGSMRFQKKAVLVVTKEADVKVLKNSRQPWRGVRVEISLSLRTVSAMRPILGCVDFISLITLEEYVISYATNGKRLKLFMRLFGFTPKLTHLEIDARILEKRMLGSVPPPEIIETLKKLKKIEILEWDMERREFKVSSAISKKKVHTRWDIDTDSVEDLERMQSVMNVALYSENLEVFNLTKVMTRNGNEDNLMILKYIPLILGKNRETLQELSIHESVWTEDKKLETVVFSRLKRLTAFVGAGNQQDILTEFLDRHPSLEELDIGVQGKFRMAMMTAVRKRSSKLKKLHIKAKEFVGCEGGGVDWSFLGTMKLLKDFKITRVHSRVMDIETFGTGPHILTALPKNQLEKLSFSGFSKVGFWYSTLLGEQELSYKTELLQGFNCLKSLSFLNCRTAVNDELMQFILKEFTGLENLELVHSAELSEFGLAGINVDSLENPVNSQISLENLKALTRLTIHEKQTIGTTLIENTLSSLCLPSLKHLEYFSENAVSKKFLSAVNLRLETVAVHLPYNMNAVQAEKLMRSKSGRCVKVGGLNHNTWPVVDSDEDDEAGFNEFNDDDSWRWPGYSSDSDSDDGYFRVRFHRGRNYFYEGSDYDDDEFW